LRARTTASTLLAGLASGFLLYGLAALAVPASAHAGPCDAVPGPFSEPCNAGEGAVDVGGDIVGGAQDVIENGPAGAAEDVAGDLAGAAGEGVLGLIRDAIVGAAVWFLEQIASLVDSTTNVNLTSVSTCIDPSGSVNSTLHGGEPGEGKDCYRPVGWFGDQYSAMWGMASVFAVMILLFVVFEAAGRGDLEMLWKAALIRLPLAFAFTGGAIALTGMLLELTDAMSAGVIKAVEKDAGDFFSAIVEGSQGAGGAAGGATAGAPGALAGAAEVPVFVAIVGALVMVVGALFVWLELIVRAASIYIVVFFLPFAFMAMIWPRTQGILKRAVELLAVLIFSKFVIVAILALSAAALGNANEGAGFAQVLAGGAMLLLAAFSPFVLFKLVPFAEAGVAAAYSRRTAGGAAVGTAQTGSNALMMRQMATANWGGGGSSGGGGNGAGPAGGGAKSSSPAAGATPGAGGGAPGGGGAAGPAAAAGGVKAAAEAGPQAADRLGRTATAQAGDVSGPPVAPSAADHPRHGASVGSEGQPSADGPPAAPQSGGAPVPPPPTPDEERPRPPKSPIDGERG
jgi:type IV secretion system protein TrbL